MDAYERGRMFHEIKGKLARLLATENLIVEHRAVETAQFDVVRRVLTLPNWKISSTDVYDLLVSHEVGHALFTDPRNWSVELEWSDVPQTFVNITEDARIEKLMKRRYAGLCKTFYRGYSDLNDSDFFDIEGQDLDRFSFADRINLHFKLGTHVNIEFSEKEMVVVDAVENAETFDDALMAAKLLNNFVNDEPSTPEIQPQVGNTTSEVEQEGMTHEEMLEEAESREEENENTEQDSEQSDETETETESEDFETVDEQEPKTVEAFENRLKNLADMEVHENNYVTIPKIDLKHTVISSKEIHEYAEGEWQKWFEERKEYHSYYTDILDRQDNEFNKFKKDSNKEVNYLIKEFECKKSADSYARATTSRTGVLDCTKLHTYKYNEDLFKKVTTTPDGKNHGLIFVLDWSGSMANSLIPTIKQLYNLIWFCRKVGIPYDVYAFTSEWNYKACRFSSIEKKEGTISVSDEFSMLNLLTSSVNNATANRQMLNVWRLASSFTDHSGLCPARLYLSGTPLNEAIITLHYIIPDFKKRNRVEKINCVILTDGEAQVPSRTVMMKRSWECDYSVRNRRIGDNTILRNLKTGTVRPLSWIYSQFTKCMLTDLKETFPNTNFIGFRILEHGGSYSAMIRQYIDRWEDQDKAMRSWKKEKTFTIKNAGYDSYFVVGNSSLSNSTEFAVNAGASKATIKNAFKKSLSSKKMNKRILNEFISLVA
jgi:hypothetical protein